VKSSVSTKKDASAAVACGHSTYQAKSKYRQPLHERIIEAALNNEHHLGDFQQIGLKSIFTFSHEYGLWVYIHVSVLLFF
jgi:hypothetical protein